MNEKVYMYVEKIICIYTNPKYLCSLDTEQIIQHDIKKIILFGIMGLFWESNELFWIL